MLKQALAGVKHAIKQATGPATVSLRLGQVLRKIDPILRGWAAYFRYGVSKKTFSYLGYYAWWRMIYWIRRKHPHLTWKQIRRRYYGPAGSATTRWSCTTRRAMRWVRRAGTGKPATETLHGAPSPTQQIQALDRTQPMLPVRPGLPASRTHDYVRHGTTTLVAALEVATGKVVDACYPRHRHQEFLRFLRQVAKAYPRKRLHIVCDNYATHKHANVVKCLAKHPRIRLHFTPTSSA